MGNKRGFWAVERGLTFICMAFVVFTLWLNSLDVDPGVYNLFEDLKVSLFIRCSVQTV